MGIGINLGNFGTVIRNLTSIRNRTSGFYRPNRFELIMMAKSESNFPVPIDPLLVTDVNMPGRTVGDISLFTDGFEYKFAGAPKFNQLTINIRTWNYVDYRAFQGWMNFIHNVESNKRADPRDYKTSATLRQLPDAELDFTIFNGMTSNEGHTMVIEGLYPVKLDDVTFSQEPADKFVSFSVTFNVDYVKMMDAQ